jgi:hypothetical protein
VLLGWCLGDEQQALAQAAEVIARARSRPVTLATSWTFLFAAFLAYLRRDPDATSQLATEALKVTPPDGNVAWAHAATTLGAWAAAAAGDQKAWHEAERGLDSWGSTPLVTGSTVLAAATAESMLVASRPERALAVLDRALALVQDTDERVLEAELHRLKGLALTAVGNATGAQACFQTALAVARAQHARPFERRAAAALTARQPGPKRPARRSRAR